MKTQLNVFCGSILGHCSNIKYVTLTWLRIPILFVYHVFNWIALYSFAVVALGIILHLFHRSSIKACLPYLRLGFFAVPTCKYCVEYRTMLSLCGNHQAWFRKFVRRTAYCIYLQHGSCCSFSPFLLPNFPFCSVPSDCRTSSSHSLSPDPLAINPPFPRFPHLKAPLLSLYSWRIFCLFVSCQIQNSWLMAPVVQRLENAVPFPVASMVWHWKSAATGSALLPIMCCFSLVALKIFVLVIFRN